MSSSLSGSKRILLTPTLRILATSSRFFAMLTTMLSVFLLLFFLHFRYKVTRIEHFDAKFNSLVNYLNPLLLADGVTNSCRVLFRIKLNQLGCVMNKVITIS